MSQALLVAGLGWGDESKGATIDSLCREFPVDLIVRYNGGSQAAHSVVTPKGIHHTFAQFGSGMMANHELKTHLSRFMLIDPITMMNEASALYNKTPNVWGRLTISAKCVVITPLHKRLNQWRERRRDTERHGSCGMGVGVAREFELKYGRKNVLCAEDIFDWNDLTRKLNFLQDVVQLEIGVNATSDISIEEIKQDYNRWKALVTLKPDDAEVIGKYNFMVFEGAQGVLLDEKHGQFPHNTWTDTTFGNADTLLDEAGVVDRTRIGCLRTYHTRHGAGPFPTEETGLDLPELHNATGEFNGSFRVGTFDFNKAREAINIVGGIDYLALSHIDYLPRLGLNSDFPEKIAATLDVELGITANGPTALHRKIEVGVTA